MKLFISLLICLCLLGDSPAQNWTMFRGNNASGVADGSNPPTNWDAEKSINILWKTAIPGLGHSSPVVWGDRIFVTTAVSSAAKTEFVHGDTDTLNSANDVSKHSWRVYCLDKSSGRVVWEKTLAEGVPKVKRHVKASHANSTPATDGRHVVAFLGSEGLYCLDVNGKLLWRQDLGVLDGGWTPVKDAQMGFGSSPVIYKNLVIVQCDTQSQSFIAAYNLSDGKRVWLTPRGEDTSWTTPVIYEGKSRVELITSGTKFYRAYDPATGKEWWRMADGVDVKIPTPVVAHDLVYLGGGSSHARRVFYAVRLGADGEIKTAEGDPSGKHIAWYNPAKPHVVTPLVYGDYLYICTDNGVLSQFNARTGEPAFRARLGNGGTFTASPVAADGKVYFASEDGEVFVLKAGPQFELLARNPVGEVMMATPAIVKDMLIIRGQHHLFAVKEGAAAQVKK